MCLHIVGDYFDVTLACEAYVVSGSVTNVREYTQTLTLCG